MKIKKTILFSLCVLVMTAGILAGCQNGNSEAGLKETEEYTVGLIFASEEYLNTGDEDLPKLMEPYEKVIESTKDEIYLESLKNLNDPPEGGYVTVLPENCVRTAALEGNMVVVDVNAEALESGGSLEEWFFIAQIVNTLYGSFEEVEQVLFTVDGEEVETLMGHLDVSKPLP